MFLFFVLSEEEIFICKPLPGFKGSGLGENECSSDYTLPIMVLKKV